ncbi:MAG: hypothetical protein AAF415_10430 [Pseudomonadota bacterium]
MATPGQQSGDYFNVDFGASYEYEDFEIRAFVRNAFNDLQYFQQFSAAGDGEVLPPRTFGVTVTAKF